MAQTKNDTATVSDLNDQIATLKTDIAAITEIIAEMGSEKRHQAQARVRDAAADVRARGEQSLREVQAQAEDMTAHAVDAVRQQPAAAVGMAVGVGFLIGFLTARK